MATDLDPVRATCIKKLFSSFSDFSAFRTEWLVRHSITFGFSALQKKLSDSALRIRHSDLSFLRKFSRTPKKIASHDFTTLFCITVVQTAY